MQNMDGLSLINQRVILSDRRARENRDQRKSQSGQILHDRQANTSIGANMKASKSGQGSESPSMP